MLGRWDVLERFWDEFGMDVGWIGDGLWIMFGLFWEVLEQFLYAPQVLYRLHIA